MPRELAELIDHHKHQFRFGINFLTIMKIVFIITTLFFVSCGSEQKVGIGSGLDGQGNFETETTGIHPVMQDSELTRKVFENPKDSTIEIVKHESDCGLIGRGIVEQVFSGNMILARCGINAERVLYLGVSIDQVEEENLMRLKSLNEFLTINREVGLAIYGKKRNEFNEDILIAEIFVNGKSVNISILESGLAKIDNMPKNFERGILFKKIAEAAAKRDTTKISEGSTNQVSGNKNIPLGCGTLPCRPTPQD